MRGTTCCLLVEMFGVVACLSIVSGGSPQVELIEAGAERAVILAVALMVYSQQVMVRVQLLKLRLLVGAAKFQVSNVFWPFCAIRSSSSYCLQKFPRHVADV